MAVAGAETRLVFCEGKPDSLDSRILNRALVGRSDVLIVPSGGKRGLRAFIEGHLARYRGGPPSYVAFRDRDLDIEPTETGQLMQLEGSKPIFVSHRACVESYLLDEDLIDTYWSESSVASVWRHGPSPGPDSIREWIAQAAKLIESYQAVRWALSALKPGIRWPQVRTTWTDGSGKLPTSLAADDCVEQAGQLIDRFRGDTRPVSRDGFLTHLDNFAKRISSPAFWDQRDYLVWFHGKDLKAAMQKMRPNSISLNHFCDWAADHLDLQRHTDLIQLRAKIKALR